MKLVTLMRLTIGVIISILCLSGCLGVVQPDYDDSPVYINDKTNLSNDFKTKLLNELVGKNGYIQEKVYYKGKTYYLSVHFYINNNQILIEDVSTCGFNCRRRTNTEKFYKKVNDKREYLDRTFQTDLNVYPRYKDKIESWIKKLDTVTLKWSLVSKMKLDSKTQNKIKDSLKFKKTELTPHFVYALFRENFRYKNIDKFLNEDICIFKPQGKYIDVTDKNINFSADKFSIFSHIENELKQKKQCITYNNINNTNIIVDKISFNFFKGYEKFSFDDLEFELRGNQYSGGYWVKITNKSRGFIKVGRLSLYFNGAIRTINLIEMLPPNATTLNEFQIYLPSSNSVILDNLNKVVDFGIAGEYEISGKIKNFYSVKNLTIKDF